MRGKFYGHKCLVSFTKLLKENDITQTCLTFDVRKKHIGKIKSYLNKSCVIEKKLRLIKYIIDGNLIAVRYEHNPEVNYTSERIFLSSSYFSSEKIHSILNNDILGINYKKRYYSRNNKYKYHDLGFRMPSKAPIKSHRSMWYAYAFYLRPNGMKQHYTCGVFNRQKDALNYSIKKMTQGE